MEEIEITLIIDSIVEEGVSPACHDRRKNGLGNVKRSYMHRLSTLIEMNETTGKNRDDFVNDLTPRMNYFEPESMVEVDDFEVRGSVISPVNDETGKKNLSTEEDIEREGPFPKAYCKKTIFDNPNSTPKLHF